VPDELEQNDDGELHEDATLEQVRAALKREQKRRKEATEQASAASAAQRELTFLKAGVDTTTPIGKLYMRGYDGELDVEAIKVGYSEIAPSTPPPAAEPTPPANDAGATQGSTEEDEAELRRARQALQSGSTPPGGEPAKPLGRDIMDAAFEAQNPGGVRARPSEGMNDRAMNAGFSQLFGRANADDPEAVFKRPNETWADATNRWRRSKA